MCYTDPSRNISVGDTKAEMEVMARNQAGAAGASSVTCHKSRVTCHESRVTCHVWRAADDEDQDSAVYHRQAVHFLAKQDYPSALAAVERARMIALSSLDQVYLDNIYISISMIWYL